MTKKTTQDWVVDILENVDPAPYGKYIAKGQLGYFTKSLFGDLLFKEEREQADFWLEIDRDGDSSKPVFRDIFIEIGDPTGYKMARYFLGSYEHWEVLMARCDYFRVAVEKWLKELKTKMTAEAVEKIRDLSEDSTPATALSASKYLATHDYSKQGSGPDRGRPSKSELKGELKRQAEILEDDKEAMERMGIRIN